MVNRNLVGLKSKEIKIRIEEEQVRRFSQAVGIPFEGIIPPTYVAVVAENILEIDLQIKNLIHLEQKIYYYGSLMIGDVVTCAKCVIDVYEVKNALGSFTHIVQETTGVNPIGEIVFIVNEIYLARG